MRYLFIFSLLFLINPASAQQLQTRTGQISFFSETPLENIEAVSNQSAAMLHTESGKLVVQMLVKSFRFKKKLMEEHFNENYMESDKFPKAGFDGVIENIHSVDFQNDGEYPVTAIGKLTMHGVTKEVKVPGSLIVRNGQVTAKASFIVKPEDHEIKIPSIVRKNIAEKISVTVNLVMHEK